MNHNESENEIGVMRMYNSIVSAHKICRKSLFKSLVSLCLIFTVILGSFSFLSVPSSASASPSKVINLVFDDSESMIIDFGMKTQQDKWCQAKYALEIFAAMLDKKDVLNIYYMSDYCRKATGDTDKDLKWYALDRISNYDLALTTFAKPLTVKGTESAQDRVDKIHNKITVAGSTPFYVVEKAYSDLKKATGFDQKWFVVLTDGAFIDRVDVTAKKEIETNKDEVKSKFMEYNGKDGIRVEYFGIGKDSLDLTSIGSNFRRAVNSEDVPTVMRLICQDVYNRPSMGSNYNEATKEINVEIPLSQIVIFTQGEDSKVNGVSGINETPSVCNVKYSTKATTSNRFPNYYQDGKYKYDTSLTGSVYIYEGKYAPGKYKISTNAKNVEVYYLLDVTPKVYLYNADSEETIPVDDKIVAGTYTINCILEDEDGNNYSDKIKSNVTYKVNVGDKVYANNESITLSEGDVTFETEAAFDITGQEPVSNIQTGKVKAADLVIKPEKKEIEVDYSKLGEEDYKNNTPIVINATCRKEKLTQEEWKNLKLTAATKTGKENIDFIVTLGKDVSTYYIYPKWKDNNKKEAKYGKMKVFINAELAKDGSEILTSKTKVTLNVKATLWEKIVKNLKWIIPILALLLLYIIYKSTKAYPSVIRSKIGRSVGKNVRLNGDTLSVIGSQTTSGRPQVSFSTKKVDRRWTTSSARRICLTGISSFNDVTSIQVKGKTYDFNPSTCEWEPKFKETEVSSNARFNLSKPSADIDFNCKLYTKKK